MIVENELNSVGDVREDVQDEEQDKGDGGVVAHHAHQQLQDPQQQRQ